MKEDIHEVWLYVAKNEFEKAAKIYIYNLDKKNFSFKETDERKIKTGLLNIARVLQKDIKSLRTTKVKKDKFVRAVLKEIQRRMKNHNLDVIGFLKIHRLAKEAGDVGKTLKEEILNRI